MYNTTELNFLFNGPDKDFNLPCWWRPGIEAGFTAVQLRENDPLVLGVLWLPPWKQVCGHTPACITGCVKTSPGFAGPKDATPPVVQLALRHGCPPPPPVPLPVRPLVAASLSVAPGEEVSGGLTVDFLNFTYSVQSDELLEQLRSLLGDDWQDMEKGLYGYLAGQRCGNVTLLWAGSVVGMGVHVQLSGQGCRELEGRHSDRNGGLKLDWRIWLAQRLSEGARFVQTHFAFDDKEDRVSVDRIKDAFKAGQIVTRFAHFEPVETYGPDAELTSHGFYFGKRSQDTSICVYDKKLEQSRKGVDLEGYAEKIAALEKGWTRIELRNRNKRSQSLVERIVSEGWSVVAGVLRGYLDVRVPTGEVNKHRWEIAPWWREFIGWATKCRLVVEGVARTLQGSMAWLDRQAGAVLAMISEVLPDPVGFLTDIARRGAGRLGNKHRNMIAAYKRISDVSIQSADLISSS